MVSTPNCGLQRCARFSGAERVTAAVFANLRPQDYQPHALHAASRMWPETNCFMDLWIEIVHASGQSPEAMLAVTLAQDFEGDQFTFFKVPLEDLEALYGISSTELAIYDRVEDHIAVQIARGRLAVVELDSYFLPDTQGVGYHQDHGKTSVAINRLDIAGRSMDYFHNGGFYPLSGDDFDGLFQRNAGPDAPLFLPYTEFSKFPVQPKSALHVHECAQSLLCKHFARRPQRNPIAAFADVFPAQAEAVADRPFGFFHKYAFNTLRQFGANFELCAAHLEWLGQGQRFDTAVASALRISEIAKSTQFNLARAVSRRKFEPLSAALEPAISAWDDLMLSLSRELS